MCVKVTSLNFKVLWISLGCLKLALRLRQYRIEKVLYSENTECKEAKPESCLMLTELRIHCMNLHSGLCKGDAAKENCTAVRPHQMMG